MVTPCPKLSWKIFIRYAGVFASAKVNPSIKFDVEYLMGMDIKFATTCSGRKSSEGLSYQIGNV
ncbi:hypothetical protein QF019_003124 [Pseudomonas frederiksbergensis]